MENNDEKWFEKYEQQLKEFLEAKADIDSRLDNLRKQILVQMIDHKEEKLKTDNFSVTLAPPRYFVQFDSKRFKEEHEDLFAQYSAAKQKEATIIIKKRRTKSTGEDEEEII